MSSGLFSFFRGPRPSAIDIDVDSSTSSSASPSPPFPDHRGQKRRTTPPLSGRSAAAVKERWQELDKDKVSRESETPTTASSHDPPAYASWISRFKRLRLGRLESPEASQKGDGDQGGQGGPDGVDDADSVMDVVPSVESVEHDADNSGITDDISESGYTEGPGTGMSVRRSYLFPEPVPMKGIKTETLSGSFNVGCLGNKPGNKRERARDGHREVADSEEEEDDEYDDYDDDNDDEDDDEETRRWIAFFEEEPAFGEDDYNNADAESEWEVDEDELTAYEDGVEAIDGFAFWTRDEQRLHRLLSLRGFHPLMPATWTRDFLGVPMYPSLFAPPDRTDKPVVIYNKSSQFRATKALRTLFDLQARVSSLRQTGNTGRIGTIIERELRRYIAWAAQDAGLDRWAPLADMPNIAAKRFSSGSRRSGPGGGGRKRTLARRIQDYFRDWAARYRTYYERLPPFEERETGEDADEEGPGPQSSPRRRRRLRPPRLLYGFVIVQHAVMLLAVDAARPRARPRCFADFNMSLGDHWLDASLNVAIPVHLARAAQMRCVQGLVLPEGAATGSDEDA